MLKVAVRSCDTFWDVNDNKYIINCVIMTSLK